MLLKGGITRLEQDENTHLLETLNLSGRASDGEKNTLKVGSKKEEKYSSKGKLDLTACTSKGKISQTPKNTEQNI